MSYLIVLLSIVALILLITWGKLHAFLAFLLVSILAGILLGLPPGKIVKSLEVGVGDTLGPLLIIISLGAMLGKLVAASGAANTIATVLMNTFGIKYVQWALMITGFIIGIPLFYGVGFVLLVPLIFSVVYRYKLPAVYIGLPMLAALSVTHGFLPPHPSPTTLITTFNAKMGLTLLYGLIVAVPTIIIAGPIFCSRLKHIKAVPLQTFMPEQKEAVRLPGKANSFLTSLLPVFILILTTALPYLPIHNTTLLKVLPFIGNPVVVMLISVLVATYTLGIAQGKRMKEVMDDYSDAIKDIGLIVLIVAGAGALKQVLADSGISQQIGVSLQAWHIHPLLLGWLMAALIRVCIGSATIAGFTTAGILAPMVAQTHVNPELMVLSVGAGSLLFSHVNDSGFWLYKEYFNLSIKDTLKTWSVMETIVSVVGLIGVLILHAIIT